MKLTPFLAGVQDGLTPYALTTIVIFAILLSRFGTSTLRVVVLGLLFVVFDVQVRLGVILGLYDSLYIDPTVQKLIHSIYFIIGGVFVLCGCKKFLQWQELKRAKRIVKSISFLAAEGGNQKSVGIFLGVRNAIVLFAGMTIAAMTLSFLSGWEPPSELLLIMYSYLRSGNDALLAWQYVFSYLLGFIFPLMIVWVGMVMSRILVSVREYVLSRVMIVEFAFSMVSLSIGLGLMSLTIKGFKFFVNI